MGMVKSSHRSIPLSQRFGSFIEDVHLFDEKLFGLGKSEAAFMDPQQRILLECVYKSIGQTHEDLSTCSVAVGVSYNEYFLHLLNMDINGLTATSGTLSVLSGRISFIFDFNGPSKSIDTACSSSLVCVHLSITSSISNGSKNALACGVNLLLRHETSLVLAGAQMLSTDGRCKTLDSRGDGYGRSEGCVVHRLAQEKKSSDLGIAILGTAVGQDGRSSSLTAPNGPAQQRVIHGALNAASKASTELDTIEMHGTGTALGDPIEVGALSAVFDQNAFLRLQSIKSMALHSEPAAGAMGMLNCIDRLTQEKTQSSFGNLTYLNPYVSRALHNTRRKILYVPRDVGALVDQRRKSLNVIGVSSFAFQGTNSHVLIGKSLIISNPRIREKILFERKSHWWSFVNFPIFVKFYLQRVPESMLNFVGKITANDNLILYDDIINGICVPAAMMASLGANICSHMTSDQVSLSESSLFWFTRSRQDSVLSLRLDFQRSKMKIETFTKPNDANSILCCNIMRIFSNFAKDKIPGRLHVRSLPVQYHASHLYLPMLYTIEYHSRDIKVGYDSMRSDIISEVIVQPYMKESQGTLTIKHIRQDRDHANFCDHYLGSAVSLIDSSYVDCGIWIEGIEEGPSMFHDCDETTQGDLNALDVRQSHESKIFDIVKETVIDVLGLESESVNIQFGELGIDSISSLELKQALETIFHTNLPATIIFDYPNISSLTSYIYTHMTGENHFKLMEKTYAPNKESNLVVVLSMAGACGGCSVGMNLVDVFGEDKDRVSLIPYNRWYTHPESSIQKHIPLFGCWMKDIEAFDSELLRIAEQESIWLDPQIKVLLEAACQAVLLQFAVIHKSSIWGSYIGCVWTEFPTLLKNTVSKTDLSHLTGSGLNFSSGRISFSFDLKGPCIGVDTACSSSLVALHMACLSSRLDIIDYGLSGGTNLMLLPSTSQNLAMLRSLSYSGRCKTFDEDADGYGRGEGCSVIILGKQTHSQSVLAYLKGSACNQDGRSSSLTAPNGPSQSSLVRMTLSDSSMTENEVSVIHLHGTGTALGDPIEIGALSSLFQQVEQPHQIVSLKSSICHTEGAAGLHGVGGALTCFSKSRHLSMSTLRNWNSYITQILNRSKALFTCSRQASSISQNPAMGSTVSSFGMSGTNACTALDKSNQDQRYSDAFNFCRRVLWPCLQSTTYYYRLNRSRALETILECNLSSEYDYLSDHIVGEQSILPGAGMFCLSSASISRCFMIEKGSICLNNAIITSPIPTKPNLNLLFRIDLPLGMIGIISDLGQSSSVTSFKSKLIGLSDLTLHHPGISRPRYQKYLIDIKYHIDSGSFGDIRVLDERQGPAIFDCSIHLGPATSSPVDMDTRPRAVVGVEIFFTSSLIERVMSAIVQKSIENGTIFTNHWVVNSSENMTLNHKIFNLQSKAMRATSETTANKEQTRYVVLYQANEANGHVEERSSGHSLALKLCINKDFVSVKHQNTNLCHSRSVAWLTEAIQTSSGRRLNLSSIEVFSRSSIPQRQIVGQKSFICDIRPIKSYLNVIINEIPRMTLHALSFDTYSVMSMQYPQVTRKGVEAIIHDKNINLPILVHEKYEQKQPRRFGEIFVTGGMGALGTLISTWVAKESRCGGSFIGRTGRTNESMGTVLLSADKSSAAITFIKADSSKTDDLSNAVLFEYSLPSIFILAGGLLESKLINNITLKSIRNIFGAKVSAADVIGRRFTALPMHAGQMFSSLAAFQGVRGQSVYASANGALDAFGEAFCVLGIPIVSVQWGNWGGRGMAAEDHTFIDIMKRMGMGMIHPSNGLKTIQNLLAQVMGVSAFRFSIVMVNIFMWERIGHGLQGGVPFVLRDMMKKEYGKSYIKKSYSTMNLKDIQMKLSDLSVSLGFGIGQGGDFMAGGLDSISLTQFSNDIHKTFDIYITPAELFNFSDLDQMSSFIFKQKSDENPPLSPESEDSAARALATLTDIVLSNLGYDLGPDEPLLAAGLDSLALTNLSSLISSTFGIEFLQTELINYPTIRDVANFILSNKTGNVDRIHTALIQGGKRYINEDKLIGINSISFLYPSELLQKMNGLTLYHESHYDNVKSIPLNRWDADAADGNGLSSGMTRCYVASLKIDMGYSHFIYFPSLLMILICI